MPIIPPLFLLHPDIFKNLRGEGLEPDVQKILNKRIADVSNEKPQAKTDDTVQKKTE